ncbi:MAG: hypothetical protein GY719_37200 [bacterium]|nr:hypothetical protein [bacterium]
MVWRRSTTWIGGLRGSRLFVLLVCALLLGACPEAWQPREKARGSALWLGTRSVPLEASDLARLTDAGVGEVFFHAARLEPFKPGGPLIPIEAPTPPPSMPATLAVAGEWTSGEDPAALADRVVESLRQLRFDIEDRGGVPAGLHFDLSAVDSFESYAEFLTRLRKELDRNLFLSTSLKRDWLDEPGVEQVARAVDFVVPFLYGQRVDETEDGKAWDFVELEIKLQKIEHWGTPYMIGVIELGTATHLGVKGAVKARTTRLSLQEMLWNRDLKLRPGFSLEGVNRRVYAVGAERATRVGKWELKSGEGVRVVRAATSDIEELTRLVDAWEVPNHLGQVYYRLPSEEEKLSLTLENLLNALDPSPASPELEFGVSLQRRTGRGWLMRFSIENTNGEITELSLIDSNYVQITALNGEFSARVKAGDFYRYELYKTQAGGEPRRDIRRPDLLRFHLPILEGRQQLTSGDVEVKVKGTPELELEGQFLLPDGRTLKVGPAIWRGGRFEGEEDVEGEEDAAEAAEVAGE